MRSVSSAPASSSASTAPAVDGQIAAENSSSKKVVQYHPEKYYLNSIPAIPVSKDIACFPNQTWSEMKPSNLVKTAITPCIIEVAEVCGFF